ncbi:MAG TPA: hypothetical protein VE078_13615 [Thermoanaerobaculia bacterium]|nr:hypothetical protein [Thermoanaerobaculia bacterium]
MSIYATLWRLKFPEGGDEHIGCEWEEVIAQGVPAHIGSPTPGCGYEKGDPYSEFLPPPLVTDAGGDHEFMRAVVIVRSGTLKGTARSPQEYVRSLLVLTGEEYTKLSFEALYERVCEALRGGKSRLVAQWLSPDGKVKLIHEDGSTQELDKKEQTPS